MTEMPDEDLMERLRAIARQRAPVAAHGGVSEEPVTEWIAADRIKTLLEENAQHLVNEIAIEGMLGKKPLDAIDALRTEIANLKQSLAEAEGQIQHLEQRLSEAAEIIRPFAAVPPVTLSELDQIPLYAAHYWAVVGSPGKTHFTREDLARARDFLATMGDRHD
jgi:hypothetical protein